MPQTEEGEESLKEKVSARGGQSTVPCAVQGIRKCPSFFLCLLSRRWPVSQRAYRRPKGCASQVNTRLLISEPRAHPQQE